MTAMAWLFWAGAKRNHSPARRDDLVGAFEGGGGHAISVRRHVRILHDGVAQSCDHRLAPRCGEGEISLALSDDEIAQHRPARPEGAPAFGVRLTHRAFIAVGKPFGGHEVLLVAGFRTPIAHNPVAL